LLLLGYALSVAARTGALTDVYVAPAKSYLQTKREAGEVLTRDEWQALCGSLIRALALAPGDTENLSELGRLHRILLDADDLDAGSYRVTATRGAGYYQAALALRPKWPWDWGNQPDPVPGSSRGICSSTMARDRGAAQARPLLCASGDRSFLSLPPRASLSGTRLEPKCLVA